MNPSPLTSVSKTMDQDYNNTYDSYDSYDTSDSSVRDITDASGFSNDDKDSIIKVVGVGGGGGNAVNYMYRQNIPYVNFVVCNTDQQALEMSPVPNKLLLGYEITRGRGAGNIPEKGKQCALASEKEILQLFQDQTEMVFITAGMGGGTGTGAAPVVARIAREAGMLTIGIVTVPFMFEGDKKIIDALAGAREMQKHVDALLLINNENLIELYKDLNFFNAFEKADDTLANAARSISEIISEKCYINVDFQDVKTILKDSGTAIISTGFGEGEHRISKAIHNALHSPLLKKHDINTSKRILLKFSISRNSKNPVQAGEIAEITQFTAKLPPTIAVKWGIADVPEMEDRVKITVLASGFDVTLREEKHSGDSENDQGPIIITADRDDNKGNEVTPNHTGVKDMIAEVYGTEKVTQQIKNANKIKYAVLKPSQFDDHEVIALLEQTRTYNRDPQFNERIRKASEGNRTPDPRNPDFKDGSDVISFGED